MKIIISISIIILLITFFVIIVVRLINKENSNDLIAQPTQSFLPTPSKEQLAVKGSIPYWDQDNAFESFQKNVQAFNYINLFWYFLTNNGEIKKYDYAIEDQNLIAIAHANNVKVMAVITNLPEIEGSTWDSKRVENVIKNSTTRKKHILDITDKLESLNFDGVNIDYESLDSSQKDNFTFFIKELTSILHEKNKIVSVSLHPKREGMKKNEDIGAFQDWIALATVTDQLNIMAYGEHWDEGNAGPIASYNWVKNIIEYTQKLNLPPEKLFLGIPLYGYDWNKDNDDKAKGLTFIDVENLRKNYDTKEKWDNNFRSPYFFYDDGDTHEVWFENARSINEKIQLAKQAGFKGITFWRLGGEDSAVWENWQF
ncbi:MAG: glycosyl hydrolase family 18 protein [Candidatus Levybacteria bacterium]|nr:glycosyl hydrolase family 18 protein [Candidatus Levybacteria bacterium]